MQYLFWASRYYRSISSPASNGTLGLAGVIVLLSLWHLFKKAGKPGWGALVPGYNLYLLCELTLGNGWLALLVLVPFLNYAMLAYIPFKLADAFGKRWPFGLGLLFLPPSFSRCSPLVIAHIRDKGRQGRCIHRLPA